MINSCFARRALAAGLGAFVWLATPTLARADDAIVTDRPDFVESSEVVGRGRVQIEMGYSSERSVRDGVKVRNWITPALVRMGVSESVELRVESDGFAGTQVQDQATGATRSERGFSDVSLGAKWRMQDGDEARGIPAVAWLLHVDIDSGSSAFRGQTLRPSLRAVAEWDLPYDFSVGVMPGVLFDKNAAGEGFAAGILGVTLGKFWTPAWHTFVELAAQQVASERNGGSLVTFDAGVSYLVTESLQLDLAVSRGLTHASPDFQWGVGLSVRF
jgi:Putative MetA-pathway of phenol degradation